MKRLSGEQINAVYELLKEGKPLPDEYRWLLFEGKQETELIYAGKQREEDVIAETMAVPLQKVKVFGNFGDQWHNMLIFGDNLQILKMFLKMKEEGKLKNSDGSKGVKLIYIDPPFGTGEIYGRGDVGAYSAKLIGAKYLEWLRQRVILLKKLLSDDGSFYIRTDYHFGHYIKVLLDEVFGKENFRNEIIISRTKGKKKIRISFSPMTDSLFLYSNNRKLNEIEAQTIQFKIINDTLSNIKSKDISREKLQEILYEVLWVPLDHRPGERTTASERTVFGKIFYPPKGRHWIKSQKRLNKLIDHGKLRLKCRHCGYVHYKGEWRKCLKCGRDDPIIEILLDSEVVSSNWTDIPGYSQSWGYPTENSEQLLERIIKASSNKDDIVLDAFAGSGTTGAVAEKLGRKWIMIDSSKFAIYTMIKRMLSLREEISNNGKPLKPKPFAVYNAGLYDMKMLKELPFKEYRKFALELFQCTDEPHILAGIELDGYFGQDHVFVFKWKKNENETEYVMDRDFIDNLHSILGERIGKRFFIIAPAASVLFLEDYIEKDGIKYYVLRIPYSIIDELHKKNFKLLEQPISADISEVNKVMDQVGFDFIYPPNVECEYYIEKPRDKILEEAVIKITSFRSNIVSKKPIPEEALGFKALSMVMIDYDFNGEYFDMDNKWFASDLEKNNYEIRINPQKIGEKMMIIYMDVYGNEKKEVKTLEDFKKMRYHA